MFLLSALVAGLFGYTAHAGLFGFTAVEGPVTTAKILFLVFIVLAVLCFLGLVTRIAAAFLWFVVVVGGYVTWCALSSNHTIALDPTAWWWLPLALLFIVPVLMKKWARPDLPEGPRDRSPAAALTSEQPNTRAIPAWAWMFIFTSLVAALLSIPGVIWGREGQRLECAVSVGVAVAGAWVCAVVARRPWRSLGAKWVACVGITFASWIPLLSLIGSNFMRQ